MPPKRIEHMHMLPVVKQVAAERRQRTARYVKDVRHTRGRRLFPGCAHFVTAEEAARLLEHDDVLRPECGT